MSRSLRLPHQDAVRRDEAQYIDLRLPVEPQEVALLQREVEQRNAAIRARGGSDGFWNDWSELARVWAQLGFDDRIREEIRLTAMRSELEAKSC